jgi:enoyl-CoA hydratase
VTSGELVTIECAARVALVRLNNPARRNVLSTPVLGSLAQALGSLDHEPDVGCIVVAGDDRAFAAGADVSELAARTPIELAFGERYRHWAAIRGVSTPLVAAVSGYCLGAGCELAMACDIVIAAESAVFAQPETGLGILPGAGGTQRLARAIGKAKAMDVVLTGRRLTAREAEVAGLVARVVPDDGWLDQARKVAEVVAARSVVAQRLAKEAVDASFEVPLAAGLEYERRLLSLALASDDAREGLSAFVERRPAQWRGR